MGNRDRVDHDVVDGYIAGPDDRPGKGPGAGGERLHYWVFDGPWSYNNEPKPLVVVPVAAGSSPSLTPFLRVPGEMPTSPTRSRAGGRATLGESDSEGNQRARPSYERPLSGSSRLIF